MIPLDPPKNYSENLQWRMQLINACEKDKLFKFTVQRMFWSDIIFAFNAFFYTYDVRKRPRHHRPFCTWPFQDDTLTEIVGSINNKNDYLVEKSRDMGVSWMVISTMVWFWLNPAGGTDFLLGSRIEDYVDKKGDMRTLFEKARYLIYRLPPWLLPENFSTQQHDNYMRLYNPVTGSTITGESNNPNFSTGGRYTAVLFDEFAKWENTDEKAWTAAGDATPCRIPVSTPAGAAGQYYNLATDGNIKKARLHWTLHPEKADQAYCGWPRTKDEEVEDDLLRLIRSPWYDRECQRRTRLEIAQELDIDYIGAGALVFDGMAGRRLRQLLAYRKDITTYYDIDMADMKVITKPEPRDLDGFLAVWTMPNPKQSYVLGIDVAEGKMHGDYSVIKVLNRDTLSVDASYYSKIDEVRLARVIKAIFDFYTTFDEPWIGIETNGPGLSTFDICVITHSLTNMFMMPRFDNATQKTLYKKGWRTDSNTRPRLISGIKDWLNNGYGWCDSRLLREMTTFVRNKVGKPEAKSGCNDDEVIAFGVAIQVDILCPKEEYKTPAQLREDGLPHTIFKLEELKREGEPVTLEERCMASLIAKKDLTRQLDEFYNIL
jgi:hypothetical protein